MRRKGKNGVKKPGSTAGIDYFIAVPTATSPHTQTIRDHSLRDDWSDPRETENDNGTEFFTPPQFVTSQTSERQPQQQQDGVQIPALLQSLFGLDFLPMMNPIAETIEADPFLDLEANSNQSRIAWKENGLDLGLASEEPIQDQISSYGDDDDDGESDKGQTALTRRKPRGRRIKKVFGNLKSRVQEAKGRRRTPSKDDELTVHDGERTYRGTSDIRTIGRGGLSLSNTTVDNPWVQSQLASLQRHKENLSIAQKEVSVVQDRVKAIDNRLCSSREAIAEFELLLTESVKKLQSETVELNEAKKSLTTLEQERDIAEGALSGIILSIQNGPGGGVDLSPLELAHGSVDTRPRTPKSRNNGTKYKRSQTDPSSKRKAENTELRARCSTGGSFGVDGSSGVKSAFRTRSASVSDIQKELKRVQSSFIRVHDLDMSVRSTGFSESPSASSSTSQIGLTLDLPNTANAVQDPFFSIDQDVGSVLDALICFGYDVVTDESQRFRPLQNTQRILEKRLGLAPPESWPIRPWNFVAGDDILVWQGSAHHKGPGKDLPVIKARGIVPATPEIVMDLLLDSSRVGEYNKMSQGRSDLLYLQQGLNTKASESDYGIAGEAKIIQALNRPPVIRRNIEMMTLIYARALQEMEPCDSYISVSRSVWEDETGVAKTAKDTVRSEMLLGVTLVRPVEVADGEYYCELTTITHVQTSAVPEMLAKKMAPSHAVGYIKEIQSIFSK